LVIAIISICNCGGVYSGTHLQRGSNGAHNWAYNGGSALIVKGDWMSEIRLHLQVCEGAGSSNGWQGLE
jgi:hypothetical protein